MTEKTVDLDQRRGMTAQKATDLRRLLADVEANEKLLPPSAGRIGKLTCLQRRPRIGAKPPRRRDIYSIFSPAPWPRRLSQTEAHRRGARCFRAGSGANGKCRHPGRLRAI
jgi:hypothetical protein